MHTGESPDYREEPVRAHNVISFETHDEHASEEQLLPSEKTPPPFIGTDPGLDRAMETRAAKDFDSGFIGS